MNAFRPGDKVTAKGCRLWMTVLRAMPSGFYACGFGASGRYAGAWQADQLTHVDGAARSLYDAFDKVHDQHNLGARAETDPAIRDLLRVTNAALRAVAKHEGVNEFDLSCLPALAASIKATEKEIA